jgi:hypothetical protein
MSDRRITILSTVQDLVGSLMYYDRKEDDELGRGEIEEAISNGEISVDEIVAEFRRHLENSL